MDFKMNAVIHRGKNYNNALRSFQHKRWNFWNRKFQRLTAKRCGYSYANFAKTAVHWKASPGWLYNE